MPRQKKVSAIFQDEGKTIQEEVEKQFRSGKESMLGQIGNNISAAMRQAAGQIGSAMADAIQQYVGQMSSAMENAVSIDEDAFMNAIQVNMDQDELTELLTSMMSDERRRL